MSFAEFQSLPSNYFVYFSEIRKKLLVLCVFFVLVFASSFFLSGRIVKFFLEVFNVENVKIVIASPFQFFSLAVNAAFFLAIILTFPLAIFSIFRFFKSALTRKEIRFLRGIIFNSILLFFLGFVFGLFLMYYVVVALAGFNFNLGITNLWDISLFFSQTMLTAALLGIIFQFPIVLTILIRFDLIDVGYLKKNRHWAIFLAFLIPALLPPTDALSLLIMATLSIVIF